MGKGQRTKGNTRPANSLRSAELLSSTLGSAPINTFIGFDALKEPNDSSTIGSSNVGSLPDLEEEVDSDFKLTIKQMYKKDSITKIKALQKFAEYCNEKEYNLVKSVLSMWPRVFNKLAIDNDFRVRETTFQAQEALVKKLGKNIAPILKQIIATWVISLHDTYVVSASAAKSSFAASFSPAKQSEVLTFCKDEIINYCKDILLIQTIATIDDPSCVNNIDRESKYHRLVSCCLQGLTLLIASLNQPDTIKDEIEKLINHDNFWKLAKYEDLNVKVNWYRFKSTICEKYPTIIKTNEAKFVSSTLLQIAEKDQLLSGAIWDNVLWILVTVEEWWKHINLTKGFLPHLRKYIKEGGYGNASSIFPNLLPMLSKFPFDHFDNTAKFCDDFIESFELCINNPNHSTKEYASIVKSYFECVQYLLIDRKLDKSLEKLNSTVSERIINFVDQMLHQWADIYGLYFNELTIFITNSKDPELSSGLITSIEVKILEIIEEAIDDGNKLDMLIKLLTSMLRISNDKSSRRVKFEEDEDEESSPMEMNKIKINGIIFKDSLYKIWERSLELSLKRENQTSWLNCLRQLQELCITVNQESTGCFIAHKYLDQLKELLNGQTEFTSVSTRNINYKHIISMLLNCCDSLPRNKSEIIFYLSSHDDSYVRSNFYEILPTRIEKDSFLQEWFTTPEVTPLFDSIIISILDGFKNDGNNQSIVNDSYIGFINFSFQIENIHFPTINMITTLLADGLINSSMENQSFNSVNRLIVGIIKKLFDQYPHSDQLDSFSTLINQIASLSLNLNISDESYSLYQSTLSSGLKVIFKSNDYNESQLLELIDNMAQMIKNKIIDENISWEMSQRLESIVHIFITTIENERNLDGQSTLTINFLLKIIPDTDYLIAKVSAIGIKVFYPLWIKRVMMIPTGLKFTSDQFGFDEKFTFTIITITKILNINPIPIELTIKQLPFIIYALSTLQLAPKDLNLNNKKLIVQQLSDYVKQTIDQLDKNSMVKIFQDIIDYSKSKGVIGLIIGLELLFNSSSKLITVNPWKLEEFDVPSITIFQLLNNYCDSDYIIDLSQETLKYLLSQEEPDKLHQCYGRLSILNTCLNYSTVDLPRNDLVCQLMDHLITIKEKSESALLLECSLDNQQELAILFTIEVMKIYKTIITKFNKHLTSEQKDLIVISITAWSISLATSDPKSFTNPVKMILYCSYCDLFLSVQEIIEWQGDEFSSVREWTDFHLIRIADSLVPLIFHLNGLDFSGYQLNFISRLGSTIGCLSVFDIAQLENELRQFNYQDKTIQDLDEKTVPCPLPKEYESLFSKLNHLYINKYSAFYLCAHQFTQRLIPMMVSSCSVFDSTFDYLAPPKPFLIKLQETDLIVDTLLSEYSLGTTCCLIKPGTDSFCYTIAYLLNWLQILTFFSQLNDENRSSLAGYLTDSGYISNLLNNLFKLMPIAPDEYTFIRRVLSITLDRINETNHIQAISCLVYFHILRKMPACVRMWLSKLDKRTSDLVNRFTISTMSELIRTEEFLAIQNADSDKFKNIKVKARHSAREVVTIYEIEDMSIELTIKLADNHPLTPVTIDGGRRVGVSVPEWRNWLLQVTSFLTHQNGTVLDGLVLWNRNMSKRFEGLEECVICYFILHGSNCQVPKLTCRNCKKKFHSACLYKWFEKSNQSSCPLCRNPFDFNKSQRPGGSSGPFNQHHHNHHHQQQQQQQQQNLREFQDFI